MKLISVFRKSLRELVRDFWMLILMLITAPFFIALYWVWFGGSSTTYDVMVLNRDQGITAPDGSGWNAGDNLIRAIEGIRYANGEPMLVVERVTDRAAAEKKLRDRDAIVLLIIPEDFARAASGAIPKGSPAVIMGDLTNPYYGIASVLVSTAVDGFMQDLAQAPRPIDLVEESLGGSSARTEFETYVPGILIFAVVMLVFPTSMAVAHEIEAGTLRRLQLTRMTSFDLLGGISLAQVSVGVTAMLLTFLTAVALGFHSRGPLWVAILVAAVTALSVVGVGLLVACFSKTVNQAFLIANFPLILMMFFSGSIYPVPRVALFTLGGRTIGLYDILPPTHAVIALNKVLTLGSGLGDVTFELAAVLVLSVLYFAGGIWLFQRMHLRRQG